ncbi:MAG: acetate uptake transporter [Acidimicrobiales bacterium]|nr:acetate uptake transporter [Acidimicrobiales bacterium]
MSDVPFAVGEPLVGAEVRPVAAQPVADPLPLGIGAFAMTTFALSISNTNVWGAGAKSALALALVFGGGVQLLAGMWEFVRKNTFGATAFSSYGAFWISFYVFNTFIVPGTKASDLPVAAGVFLLCWTIFTFYMTIASLRVTGAVATVFVLLLATYILLTIGAFQSAANVTKAGGWVGVATAAAAWYAATAGVVNETFKKALIPVIPLSGPVASRPFGHHRGGNGRVRTSAETSV